MLKVKTIVVILALVLSAVSVGFAGSVADDWNDYLHYIRIARLDLAKGYAQAVLSANPEPVELLKLSEENPRGYDLLLKVIEERPDAELTALSEQLLDIIEKGRFIRRTDPKVITTEIKRLSKGTRPQLTAVKRLRNAGEYAIMYMLDAMADDSRKHELPNITLALPKIGTDAIRPLTAAMQMENVAVKAEIIKALGKIGHSQSLAYLKYVIENDDSADLRQLAEKSIRQIDPAAINLSAAQLFFRLAESYYYHAESLAPAEDAAFANIWFWDSSGSRLIREKVDRSYFYELMAMRSCEWALKADAGFGRAIGLWLASYFKAERTGVSMPNYFGAGHADALVYATTAGPEYLHQALARAVEDRNAYVALGAIEALATTAGEKSLLYRLGVEQPLVQALSFDDRAVRYSAAIAIASAGPKEKLPERSLVVKNLAEALGQSSKDVAEGPDKWNTEIADSYALRAAKVMLKLVETQNPVIDLSDAQNTLISATMDNRPQIQILASQILARLNNVNAQRAIADMALDETNAMGVRISAFNSLAVSAKINASLLDEGKIDAVYSLVSSQQADPQLRSAAASAYGALNLPSRKVKNLILDQAKS